MRRFQITIIEVDEYSTLKKKGSYSKTVGILDAKKVQSILNKAQQTRKERKRLKL